MSRFFESELIARGQLGPLWNNLREQPHYIQSFVKQMQPQVKQIVAGYNVNYRQLNDASQMGLLFDIATLSKDQIIFTVLTSLMMKKMGYSLRCF